MSEIMITCPSCRTEFRLSDVVTRQVREQAQQEWDARTRAQEAAFAERDRRLREGQQQLEVARAAQDEAVRRQVEAEKARLLSDARTHAREQLAVEMRDLQTRIEEKNRALAESQATELKLRKQQRELEERQQALELEVERKLGEERGKIQELARKTAADEQQLRFAEKEKLIGDLQKQIELLRQKVEQGSQQMQGEVLELELESLLRSQFPHDEIVPVSTGVRGADLLQRVRTPAGGDCGTIIWETKRTKHWSPAWLGKLKEDQRAESAEIALLLTQVLPEDVKNFGYRDGVWITDYRCAPGLAMALRQGLVSLAGARRSEAGKQEKMAVLYQHFAGTAFRQQIEAIVEAFVAMKTDLDAEKRAMQRTWAKREKQIELVLEGTARLYGGVQGIIGEASLPEIKVLQLEA